MRPDPEKRKARPLAGTDQNRLTAITSGTLSSPGLEVNRICRPVNAADLAAEITRRMLIRVETGSDFAERVRRTRADSARKGRK